MAAEDYHWNFFDPPRGHSLLDPIDDYDHWEGDDLLIPKEKYTDKFTFNGRKLRTEKQQLAETVKAILGIGE